MGLGETTIGLGMPNTFEYKGRTIKLSPMTYNTQAMFEAWVEKRAWDAIERAPVSPEAKQKLQSELLKSIAAGDYDFGSETVANASSSLDGRVEMLYLLMKPNHLGDEWATKEFCQKMFDEECERIMSEMNKATFDPNLKAPQEAGTTSASPSLPPSSQENHTS